MARIAEMNPDEYAAACLPENIREEYLVALHKVLWDRLPHAVKTASALDMFDDDGFISLDHD